MGRTIQTVALASIAAMFALAAQACGRTADVPDSDPVVQVPQRNDDAGGDGSGGGPDAAPPDGAAADATADATADAQPFTCKSCMPDFCGCGACTASQVVCTKTPKNCPLGCATSCDLSQFTCACSADRCVHTASTGGDIACYATADCPVGQCCSIGAMLVGKCRVGSDCL